MVRFAIVMGLVLGACGDKSTSGADARPVDAAVQPPDAAGPMLTVKNAKIWCNVTVNGGTASSAPMQSIPITAPGTITVTATPISTTFILGDWHHTDGDTGTGDPGTVSNNLSTAMVTVGTTSKCVWICCPFANPPGTGCPTTDQCP
jgi:hypothetical protein